MPAAAAIELAVDYTKQRKAFGQTLADYQNTRFKLAGCAALANVVRSLRPHRRSLAGYRLGYELEITGENHSYWSPSR